MRGALGQVPRGMHGSEQEHQGDGSRVDEVMADDTHLWPCAAFVVVGVLAREPCDVVVRPPCPSAEVCACVRDTCCGMRTADSGETATATATESLPLLDLPHIRSFTHTTAAALVQL